MPRKKEVHVVQGQEGGWNVNVGGETLSHHRTQAAAADAGRREARRRETDLNVHGLDGKIRSKDSYGNDPRSIRDTEH